MREGGRLLKGVVFLGLVVFVGLYFLREINLVTADLGRHLKNGEVFVREGKVVGSNFYSYTQPEKKVINHHWLSGVVFYHLEDLLGFAGLSWQYAMGMMVSLFLFFQVGRKEGGFWPTVLVGVLVAPLLGSRVEIRPEIFSYVFLGLVFLAAEAFWRGKLGGWWLLALVLLEGLWVNLHLFFVLGWGVLGGYLVRSLVEKKKKKASWYGLGLVGVVGASFLNPFGARGLVEPFLIFRDFGYRLLENQSLVFLLKRFPGRILYWYFLVLGVFVVGVVGWRIVREDMKSWWFEALGALFGVLGGVVMLRLFTLAGLLVLAFFPRFLRDLEKRYRSVLVFGVSFVSLGFFGLQSRDLSPVSAGFGVGLRQGVERSGEFFKENKLEGPIFNNYDIGGYLIYELYPDERVFVDNRPEAYSVSFLQDKYIKAQEKEEVWEELEKEYGFEAIYFYRYDLTPWAQPFLIRRVKDEEWVPVYVDGQVLILVRKDGKNQRVIEEKRIPEEAFVVR